MIDLKHCSGCKDDFYNGKNPLGVKQCWMRKDATLEPRILIPVDMPPPYKGFKAKRRPTCYSAQRMVSVKPERIDSRGYWRMS